MISQIYRYMVLYDLFLYRNIVDLKQIDAPIVWSWDIWLKNCMILKFLGFNISVKLCTASYTERNKLNSLIL